MLIIRKIRVEKTKATIGGTQGQPGSTIKPRFKPGVSDKWLWPQSASSNQPFWHSLVVRPVQPPVDEGIEGFSF
jgi:hypothetical protein